jgi:high-affinity iron transporter
MKSLFRYSLAVLIFSALPFAALASVNSVLQLVDYVGVDYAGAVANGAVKSAGEYSEMQEFAGRIQKQIRELPASSRKPGVTALGDKLVAAIGAREDPVKVAALCRVLRTRIMQDFPVVLVPREPPDPARAKTLYAHNCAACHGADGAGDGPAAATLDPPPINFHEAHRAKQRSLFGLFNTISLGVSGTSMKGFSNLSDADRWSLAFYVGSLYVDPQSVAAGKAAWKKKPVSLVQAVTLSPLELAQQHPDGAALEAWVRTHPAVLFAGKPHPIDIARRNLAASLKQYEAGNLNQAQSLSVSAYLDGFELIEAPLRNVDADLMKTTEHAMLRYRQDVASKAGVDQVRKDYETALQLLNRAESALSGQSMSGWVAFTSSLIILLREGLEAILVVAAMIAFLVKAERRDALSYVHGGWIVAIIAGAATWALSTYLFSISGSSREVTEGVTALVASAILFYVGYWMHRNASARRWNRYLHGKMTAALTRQTLWTLGLVSFLAVYREIFETILFYEALWLQVAVGSRHVVFLGGGVAAALLVLIVWLFQRFGMRLPLRQFFIGSALLMVLLSVIFVGQGIAALQEAGKIPSNPIPIPSVEILGIYPNVESITLQCLVILFALALLIYQRKRD